MNSRVRERLLSLDPPDRRDWLDYRAIFGDEDIDELISVIGDPDLVWAETYTPESWAPVHAWRALGQLEAVRATESLLALLAEGGDDDWIASEIPHVLADLGAGALPALGAFVVAPGEEMFARAGAAKAMARIAIGEPAHRPEVLAVLTGVLEEWQHNNPLLNALIIGSLLEFRGVEAADTMKAAFDAGRVDLRHLGDWEDVQISLGLLRERTSPRQRIAWFGEPDAVLDSTPLPARRPNGKGVRKSAARAKRKAARKSRNRNRRRK